MHRNKIKSYAVLGLGGFGTSVAKTLAQEGMEVLAVDKDPEAVRAVMADVTCAMEVDVTNEEALESLGLARMDGVIIAIGENLEASVMATILVKEMGVPLVVAKAENDLHKSILQRLGANRVLFPEKEIGISFARNLVGNYMDYFHLSETVGMVEVDIKEEWEDHSLIDLDFRNRYHLNIVAIRRGEEIIFCNPTTTFKTGDRIIAMGENQYLEDLEDL